MDYSAPIEVHLEISDFAAGMALTALLTDSRAPHDPNVARLSYLFRKNSDIAGAPQHSLSEDIAPSNVPPDMYPTVDNVSPIGYNDPMITVRQTDTFSAWFEGLRDRNAKARITARIRRLSLGNPGDVKPVGEGLSEMRIDYGPGYSVYVVQRGKTLTARGWRQGHPGPGH